MLFQSTEEFLYRSENDGGLTVESSKRLVRITKLRDCSNIFI